MPTVSWAESKGSCSLLVVGRRKNTAIGLCSDLPWSHHSIRHDKQSMLQSSFLWNSGCWVWEGWVPYRGTIWGGQREGSLEERNWLSCPWPISLSSKETSYHKQLNNYKRSFLFHLFSVYTHTHTPDTCMHHTAYTCVHMHTHTIFFLGLWAQSKNYWLKKKLAFVHTLFKRYKGKCDFLKKTHQN